MYLYILIGAGALGCAIIAIIAKKLLSSAIWLAGTSALVALLIYLLGAPEVAVIELSVGAGLVTVLFVFAINIAGDEPIKLRAIPPRWLSGILILFAIGLLGYFAVVPLMELGAVDLPVSMDADFRSVLWQERNLDVLLQVLIIFTGVLGMMGLLAEGHKKESHPANEEEKPA